MLMVSHDATNIREHCERALVLHDRTLHAFANVDAAYDFYSERSFT